MYNGTQYGTLRVLDTLHYGELPVIEYNPDRAFAEFEVVMAAHNMVMRDLFSDVIAPGFVTNGRARYGGSSVRKMTRIDMEFGLADAQKVGTGYTVGLPLYAFGSATQWTEKYFKQATVEEFNANLTAELDADITNFQTEIMRALFNPTNFTWTDEDGDGTDYPVKRLLNADGNPIPTGPQARSFDGSSHTHYMTSAALDEAAMTDLAANVMEHYTSGEARIYINSAQESTVLGLDNFIPAVDPRIQLAITSDRLNMALDLFNTYDRRIGIIKNGPEVWVKPWVPSNYLFCFMKGQKPPLSLRRDKYDPFDLTVVEVNDTSSRKAKLTARAVERKFGIGVTTRHNGAVMQITGGAYAAPSGL